MCQKRRVRKLFVRCELNRRSRSRRINVYRTIFYSIDFRVLFLDRAYIFAKFVWEPVAHRSACIFCGLYKWLSYRAFKVINTYETNMERIDRLCCTNFIFSGIVIVSLFQRLVDIWEYLFIEKFQNDTFSKHVGYFQKYTSLFRTRN